MDFTEKVRQGLSFLVNERGVKRSFIARQLEISKTFLNQMIDGERNFGSENLDRAIEFLKKYSIS